MKVHIVGLGPGNPELLTGAARAAIDESKLLIGAKRMLDSIPALSEKVIAITQHEIQEILFKYCDKVETAAIIVSGDVGFYSAALRLHTLPFSVQLHCGVSTLQYLCALTGIGWDDVKTLSLHGREQNAVAAVRENAKTFVLTGGADTPGALCGQLCDAGLEQVRVMVGENLSYPEERLIDSSAHELAGQSFAQLNAMLILNACPAVRPVTHGLSDDVFIRSEIPMTKEEVRALSIVRLRLERGMCVWDVGAGTGSVAVEIARILPDGEVWAVERKAEAVRLITENKKRFALSNLHIIKGEAPEALLKLPVPDAVFIGGGGKALRKIIELAVAKNASVRLVVNAILPESAVEASACMQRLQLEDFQMTQLSAARAQKTGAGHLMLAQNPVFILSAGKARANG